MKPKTIKIIYYIFFLLLIFFIYQELFPVLFILPIAPGRILTLLNFPLTTAIILALIPIFTVRAFVKDQNREYFWLSSIKFFLLILIFSVFIALFLPYLTFIGFKTDIGLVYSLYSGVLGIFLIFFGYFQLIANRIFFGFLIGTAGSTMGISNHVKILVYALQQYNIRIWILYWNYCVDYSFFVKSIIYSEVIYSKSSPINLFSFILYILKEEFYGYN